MNNIKEIIRKKVKNARLIEHKTFTGDPFKEFMDEIKKYTYNSSNEKRKINIEDEIISIVQNNFEKIKRELEEIKRNIVKSEEQLVKFSARVDERGRIIIPAYIRKINNISNGDIVEVALIRKLSRGE